MKRLHVFLILLVLIFNFNGVSAKEAANLTKVVNKCVQVDNNEAIVNVVVMATSDGSMSSLINEYKLGMIENDDNVDIVISDLKSVYISNIAVDTLKDSDNRSYINYNINNDIDLKKGDILMSFNINIYFEEEVLDEMYILGNEVVFGSDSICEEINGYRVDVVKEEVEIIKDYNYILFSIFLIIIIGEGIWIFKLKRK